MTIRTLSIIVAFALGVAACGENMVGSPPSDYIPRAPSEGIESDDYPVEPPEGYGGEEGEVVPNMLFQGYFTDRPSDVKVNDLEYLETIVLDDIRRLEGYSHMLLTVAAEWCKPCREEAEVLPEYFEQWAAKGGYVLGIINQDTNYNAADRRAVERWANRYKSNYTLVHDPENFIADWFAPTTVPLNVVIDLETMTVLRSRVGEDPDTFNFFERLLDQEQ